MAPVTLALTLALAAGLALGVTWPGHPPVGVALMAGAVCVGFAHRHGRLRVRNVVLFLCGVGAGAGLGSDRLHRALYPPLRTILEDRIGGFQLGARGGPRLEEPLRVEGRLLQDAAPTVGGAVLRLAVERLWIGPCPEAVAGGLLVAVSGALVDTHIERWTQGRRVRAPVLLRRPATYLNEGVPDEERALARRGVALLGSVKSASLVEVVDVGWPWQEWAAAVRARIRDVIARRVMPHDVTAAGVATAILIGDRAGLDEDVERRLQEAGTYHVIAISGGNIAIFSGLVIGLLGCAGLRGRIAAGATIATLVSYALLAGGGPSVARATVMACVYFAVRLIDQRTAPGTALALTVSTLLVVEPLAIADVGLWLTVGATAAILGGVSRAPQAGTRWRRMPGTLLLASICSELVLAPVSAVTFHRVTVAGLLLNFAAIPCMTVVQLSAMLLVAVDVAGLASLADPCGWLVAGASRGLVDSARLLDVAPWLTWRVPPPHAGVLAVYYAALVGWWCLSRPPVDSRVLRLGSRATGMVAAGAFVWIVTAPPALARASGDGRLHLTVFDVAQGDGMLVTFPNGRTLMVDSGARSRTGSFDIGERVLGPALRARGLVRLDYLAITHGDPDHIGGAAALVRDFAPREVWYGVPVPSDESTRELQSVASRAHAAWRTVQRGDRLEIGGAEIVALHPPPPDWERQRVRNDDSLVLELRVGDVSILLTGDITREVEHALVPSLALRPLVILKAPHHGSSTSSSTALLATTRPAVALFSAGRGNPYGHPVPQVLERYRNAGAEIFRTDLDGQIEVVTDGRDLRVRTFGGRSWP
jgi:competence protein ComEC